MTLFKEIVEMIRNKLHKDRYGVRPPSEGFSDEARAEMRAYAKLALIIVFAFALCFVIYAFIGGYVLDTKHPDLTDVKIPKMKVQLDERNNTRSFGGMAGVLVSFHKTSKIKAYPKFANFVLSKRVNSTHILRAISSTRYEISRNEQRIDVKFKSYQLVFQEDQTRAFQERLDSGHIWVALGGYFRMYLQLTSFLPFPHAHRNLYFGCDILLSGASGSYDKISLSRCMTSLKSEEV